MNDPATVDLVVVSARFRLVPERAADAAAALAKYVVLTRGKPGCRNVDLLCGVGDPTVVFVYEKWTDHSAHAAHQRSEEFSELASAVGALLAGPPEFDLWEPVSAHDLR